MHFVVFIKFTSCDTQLTTVFYLTAFGSAHNAGKKIFCNIVFLVLFYLFGNSYNGLLAGYSNE